MGVDDPNAVGQLSKILHGHRNKVSKPWELVPHGDIWQKVENIVEQRGRDSSKVNKVKGHATEQHIKDKIANPIVKEGNDIANHLATKAYDLFHDHVNQFANLHAHRTEHYAELVQIVQFTILRVREALQDRRTAMAMVAPAQFAMDVQGVREKHLHLKNSISQICKTQTTNSQASIRQIWNHFSSNGHTSNSYDLWQASMRNS